MTNTLRERFCAIVRDRALVPEPLLNECLREEAGISSDGTNFPLIDLLLRKQLLDPPEIATILSGIGVDTMLCPICESRHPLQRCLAPTGALLTCESCGVPMQFLSESGDGGDSSSQRPAAPADWQVEATLRLSPGADLGTATPPPSPAKQESQQFAETLRISSWPDRQQPGRPSSSSQHPAVGDPLNMSPGQVLDDRYEILEQLTQQAGTVFKALERGLDRLVAVKILDRSSPSGDRLAREIDSIGKLSHPNIITILNVGTIADKEYFVLEYVEGTDLQDMLRAGPLDFQEATRIARDLADALYHAHTRGLIHGTLSPASIRIDKAGHPYLIDFCLAARDTGVDMSHYRAPELGSARVADESSDIYSLGAIYYQMVSGKSLADGAPDASRLKSDLPADGAEICVRALDTDPARRHDSMQELRKAFDVFLESSKLASRRILLKRKSRRSLATAVGVLLLVAGGAFGWIKYGPGLPGKNGGGKGQKPSDDNGGKPKPKKDPFAAETKEIRSAYKAGNWEKAHTRLQALKKKTKLTGDLAEQDKQLDAYLKAKERENNPEELCRFLVRNALPFAKTKPFLQLVERNKLWQLVLEASESAGASPARVTLYPVDSLTLEVNREKPLELGTLPLDCPFINQQGYQIEVVRGTQTIKFPLEFRPPISDPTNVDRKKVVKLRFDVPAEMCMVPAISGAAFAQEAGADRDFQMDRLEVTAGEYQKFMAEVAARKLNVSPPRIWPNGQMPVGWERLPVVNVDFYQAAYYALWAGKRLPTKIEWNKAAGGQDQREYPWGSSFKDEASVSQEDGVRVAQAVGGRDAGESPYGIQDMSGNVWEIVVPTTAANKGKMVIRGGSYTQKQGQVTISSQRVLNRSQSYINVGFRCVRSLLTTKEGKALTVEEALRDTYAGVVIEALARLSRKGTPEAMEQIFGQLAQSPDETVRLAAAFYLMQQQEAVIRPFLENKLAAADSQSRLGAVRALRRGLRPALVPLLARLATDADPQVREAVYTSLVRFGVTNTRAIMLKGLSDKQPRIRQAGVVGLSAYRDAEVTTALRARLKDPSANVQFAAASELLRRGDTASIKPIVRFAFRLNNPNQRGQLYQGTPALGPARVAAEAASYFKDRNPAVRRYAIELVAYLGAAQYTDQIIALARDPQLRGTAIFGLANMPTVKGCAAVLPFLKDKQLQPRSISRIAQMVASVKYEPAVPALIALTKRQDLQVALRRNLLIAIGQTGGKQAGDYLLSVLRSRNHPLGGLGVVQALSSAQHPQVHKVLKELRARWQSQAPQNLPVLDYFRLVAGDKKAREPLLAYVRTQDLNRNRNARIFAAGLASATTPAQLEKLLRSRSSRDREVGALILSASDELNPDHKMLASLLAQETSVSARMRLLSAICRRGFEDLRPAVEKVLARTRPGSRQRQEILRELNQMSRVVYRNKTLGRERKKDPPKKDPPKKDPPKKDPPKKDPPKEKQPDKKQPDKKRSGGQGNQ